MGLASSVRVQGVRVQIRACSNTLAGKASARNTVLHQWAGKDLNGDQRAVVSVEGFVSQIFLVEKN